MIEQNAVACIHAKSLPIIYGDPIGIGLGNPVGAAGIKGGGFFLRDFLYKAVKFTCTGLVNPRFFGEAPPACAEPLEFAAFPEHHC